MEQILALITGRHWLALAVLVIAYLVRITASDSKFPVTIPDRWKPVVVLTLGQVYAALIAIQGGTAWKVAAFHGFMTALVTMGLFDVVAKALFNGREPAWFKALAGVPKALRDIDIHSVPVDGGAVEVAVSKKQPPSLPPGVGVGILLVGVALSCLFIANTTACKQYDTIAPDVPHAIDDATACALSVIGDVTGSIDVMGTIAKCGVTAQDIINMVSKILQAKPDAGVAAAAPSSYDTHLRLWLEAAEHVPSSSR